MGTIYFIACLPMNACKIGFTAGSARKRLAALQTGCPAPLRLYATVPGSAREESMLHEAFAPLHIQGEWFRFEGKLHSMACYLNGQACRGSFINAIGDVLQEGLWHPSDQISEEEYHSTGDWRPLAGLLSEEVE